MGPAAVNDWKRIQTCERSQKKKNKKVEEVEEVEEEEEEEVEEKKMGRTKKKQTECWCGRADSITGPSLATGFLFSSKLDK